MNSRKTPRRAASAVSNVANPFVIFTALYAAVAVFYSGGFVSASGYIALELLAAAVVAGYVLLMRRRRRVGDFWISSRVERLVPSLVLLGAFVGLLFCLLISGAPPEVFYLTLDMGLAAALTAAVTLVWKASAHAAVAGYAALAGVLLLGVFGLPFVVVLPLVVWSRIILKAHTPAQAVVGAGVGILFALPLA